MAAPYLACIALVSTFYHLPPRVLPSIQLVEGGRVGLVAANTDGSSDLGLMQINTRWIAPLAQHARLPEAMVRHRLINDPCFSIATAGAIMRIYLNEERGSLLRAVGDYHSHTYLRNQAYQAKVLAAAQRLFNRPPPVEARASVSSSGRSGAAPAPVR
jgi:hypothetical protein